MFFVEERRGKREREREGDILLTYSHSMVGREGTMTRMKCS
jgi:hypothetical protein